MVLHGFIELNKAFWRHEICSDYKPLLQEPAREMCRLAEHKGPLGPSGIAVVGLALQDIDPRRSVAF